VNSVVRADNAQTCSQAFSNALFNLATRPEYVPLLREEVEAVIKEEGWTKSAIGKLKKVDSFVRESQRLAGGGICTLCASFWISKNFLTLLSSQRDAQSVERLYVFKWDNGSCGF
jgi:hypothetical protein